MIQHLRAAMVEILSSQRIPHIRARWCDIVLMAIAGTAVWVLLREAIRPQLLQIERWIAAAHVPSLLFAFAGIGVVGLALMGSERRRAMIGFRYFWCYPPVWTSACLAVSIVSLFELSSFEPPLRIAVPLLLTCPVALCAEFAFIKSLSRYDPGTFQLEERSTTVEQVPQLDSYDGIIHWLKDDRPITSPAQDRFGHHDVARRIARRLSHSSGHEFPTIAILGDRGTGKSTILHLVEYELKRSNLLDNLIVIVPISLWPFETADAAAAGIINAVIAAIGKKVDAISLKGLGSQYVQAIGASSTFLKSLSPLLHSTARPEVLLRRMESIVVSIDLRLVIWVEDVERFAGAGSLTADVTADRLAPIRALLYLFDQCSHMSVLLADATLSTRFDPEKIARFVETTPAISVDSAWKQISMLRSGCLEQSEIFDPADPAVRRRLSSRNEIEEGLLRALRDTPYLPTLKESVALLLQSPRALKSTLRSIHDIWATLSGEIDIDDVILITTIKESRPALYALIAQNIDGFRYGLDGPAHPGEVGIDHPANKMLSSMLEKEDTVTRNALHGILEEVFPRFEQSNRPEVNFEGWNDKPQGFAYSRHVDYWRRYETVPRISREQSDQSALAAIHSWKRNSQSDLLDRVCSQDCDEQLIAFAGQFSVSEICRLLQEVVFRARHTPASEWGDFVTIPGLVAVRALVRRVPSDSELLTTAGRQLLSQLASEHLPLALAVYESFEYGRTEAGGHIIDGNQLSAIYSTLVESLVSAFGVNASMPLVEALRNGLPYTLGRIWTPVRKDPESRNRRAPHEEWARFAPFLLSAAESEPKALLPQILFFVLDSEVPPRATEEQLKYNRERSGRLFGDSNRVVDLFAEAEPPTVWSAEAQGFINKGWDVMRRAKSDRDRVAETA